MNLNINPLNFRASYRACNCDIDSKATAKNFDKAIAEIQHSKDMAIARLQETKDLAVKSQQYMEKPSTQAKIKSLPSFATVGFRNYQVDPRDIKIPNELYDGFPKMYYSTGGSYSHVFYFRLDENGNLNETQADQWLSKMSCYLV